MTKPREFEPTVPATERASTAKGPGAPAFAALSEPDDPLGPAIAAMERGDHVAARALARGLAGSADEALARRARALLDQLRPDPVIVAVMALSGLLILLLAAVYLGARP